MSPASQVFPCRFSETVAPPLVGSDQSALCIDAIHIFGNIQAWVGAEEQINRNRHRGSGAWIFILYVGANGAWV